MPNTVAYVILALWPLVSLFLYARLPVHKALIWTILGGYLFLPPLTNFDLPALPALDKVLIPNLCAFLIPAVMLKDRAPILPPSLAFRVLAVMFVLGSVPTVLTNGDPEPIAGWTLPGLQTKDIISAVGTQAIYLLPFVLARHFLTSAAAARDLLQALVIAALIYSIPALYEVATLPDLNIRIFGFFQHHFEQTARYGGFRPIVFLPHPIWLAFFVMSAVAAAALRLRMSEGPERGRALAMFLALAVVLVLCKTFGAIGYALLSVPLILLARPVVLVRVAVVLALIAVIYPILRGSMLVPVDYILTQVEALDVERAASLGFRFENEEQLLARASERAAFGWGGWGRNLVYDDITGEQVSVADGRWIIVFGSYGWLGFLGEFGLLSLPLLVLLRAARKNRGLPDRPVATVALILGLNLFDLLPNATLVPMTWLIAGTVLGQAERIRRAGMAAPEEASGGAKPRRGARNHSAAGKPRTIL